MKKAATILILLLISAFMLTDVLNVLIRKKKV